MSFQASVYRVLIASPGDLAEERVVIEEVIYHWNATHSAQDKVVLLPVRWETHSVPELGDRPQAILNRRIVEGCDILVGAFWTRLGTPTGVSDSGTMEEIEEFLRAGKPVLLYFSSREIDPDRVDLDQLKHLRDAKSRLMQRGLIEQFVSPAELRWKLSRHLQEQVRRMVDSGPVSMSPAVEPRTPPTAEPTPQAVPRPPAAERTRMDEKALGELYVSYWQAFSLAIQHSDLRLRPPSPSTRNYARLSLGSSDMRMNVFTSVRDRSIGVELVLTHPACDDAYARLMAARVDIERELGHQLEWNEFPGSFRIALVERGFDPVQRADWLRQHKWLIGKLRAYQQSLLKRIDGTNVASAGFSV